MIATDVTGTFFVPLKVTLMAAFLVALPYVLWQAWAFVAPGLYRREKKLALPLLGSALALFYAGCAFAFFLVLPMVFGFLAALIILALVFRTVAATALPLLTALVALMTGMALLSLLTHVMSVADFAPALLDLMARRQPFWTWMSAISKVSMTIGSPSPG